MKEKVAVGIPPIMSVTFSNSVNDEDHFCTSHIGNMYHIDPVHYSSATYQYRLLKYPTLNVVYTSLSGRPQSDEVSFIPSQGWYEFQVRATNDCGTGPWIGQEVEYKDCSQSSTEEGEYRISPNPASSTLTIGKNKVKRINTTTNHIVNTLSTSTYQLFDFNTNIITNGDITDITTINVSNYRKGIYILKIYSKDKSETHKVIIE